MIESLSQPFTFLNASFWAFMLVVLAGMVVSEKRVRVRNAYLFLASLFFYWKTSGAFVAILIFSTLSDWRIGGRMDRSEGAQRKRWLAASLAINLSVLLYFKYAYFIADALQPLLGAHWSQPHAALGQWANEHLGTTFRVDQILLPVGISFYTFQTMSYAIDVYRKEVEPVRSVLDFAFRELFPAAGSGAHRSRQILHPQLHQPYRLSRVEFGTGLFWILNGLIKKIWLADYLAVNVVDRVFANPGSYSGFENLIGLYAYSLQVYADFSGYTDMAIGIALLMGFHLPLIFVRLTKPETLVNSGNAGTSVCPVGSRITCTSPWVETAAPRGSRSSAGRFCSASSCFWPPTPVSAHCAERRLPGGSSTVCLPGIAQTLQHQRQFDDDHAPRRAVAWCQLEFRSVGRVKWIGPDRLQGMA